MVTVKVMVLVMVMVLRFVTALLRFVKGLFNFAKGLLRLAVYYFIIAFTAAAMVSAHIFTVISISPAVTR